MVRLRPLRLSIFLAPSLLLVGIVNAQGPPVDCKVQNTNSGCTTAQPTASTGTLQPRSSSLPKVTYSGGHLTITVFNASLADVLRAVSTETGAVIEFPADRAAELLSAQAGPGPVREVLATLLNGSRFNYVMLGSPTDPSSLERMILTNAEPSTQGAPAQLPPAQSAQVAPPANTAPPKALASGPLWTPPPDASGQVLPPQYDGSLTPPKETLSPEALGELMKQKFKEIRERVQQQNPQQ